MTPAPLPPALALREAEEHALRSLVLMQRAREGMRGMSTQFALMHLDEALRWMSTVRDEQKEPAP